MPDQAVIFGNTRVGEKLELVDILKEWQLNPPYATFWAEVQEAYLYFLTQPRNKNGYEGNEKAETLADDLRDKASEYDRRQGTDGTSQNPVESHSALYKI